MRVRVVLLALFLMIGTVAFAQSPTQSPSTSGDPDNVLPVNPTIRRQVFRWQASQMATFPQFVTWPKAVDQRHPNEIIIGLVGKDPLSQAGRDFLKGRGFDGRNFVLELIPDETPTERDFHEYQMLYIGVDVPPERVKKILKEVARDPVLTISAQPGFLEAGGIIQFHIDGKAVTFRVSFQNGNRAGLKIQPRMEKWGKAL